MKEEGHESISIPPETDKVIETILNRKLGYVSKSEVVRDAVRRLALELEKQESKRVVPEVPA